MDADNDEAFADRLAAWDEGLAEGASALTAEICASTRLASACRVLQRLEMLWPRAKSLPVLPAGFGRFRILGHLGTGGFGIVYLAEDSRLRRPVALKVPRPEIMLTTTWRERFLREARAVAQLSHPNIVPLFDSGEIGNWCFLVSAYCPGGTLGDWLKSQEALLPFKTAASLIATVADAVHHAHQRGILHRDLKPGNILLMPLVDSVDPWPHFPFVPLITDFGLAKAIHEIEGSDGDAALTRSTAILGTPAYMAPEQAKGGGDGIGPATDVYALGAILYELLTGQPPFRGASHLETLQQIAIQDPVLPSQRRAETPRDLEAICLKCLEKDASRRYPNAESLAEDLRRYLHDEPTHARPIGPVARLLKKSRRHPAQTGLAGIGAAMLVLVVAGLWWRSHDLASHHEDLKAAAQREDTLTEAAQKAKSLAEEHGRRIRLQTYATDLKLADGFARDNRWDLARDILRRHIPQPGSPDDRDFAWRFLWHRLENTINRNQKSSAIALAFSPDGQTLYVGDNQTVLQCFDVANRKAISTRQVASDLPYPLRWQFSPKADRVSVVSTDGKKTRLALFDTAAIRTLHREVIDAVGIPTSSFSPDGSRWAYCNADDPMQVTVAVLDLSTRAKVTLPGKAGYRPVVVAFAPDGATLAIVSQAVDGASKGPVCQFAFHSFKTGTTTYVPADDEFRDPGALVWSPDGAWLACTRQTGNLVLWNARKQCHHKTLPLAALPVAGLSFSPDGKNLAVIDSTSRPESQTVRTFRVEDGKPNPAVFSSKEVVHGVAWSPVEDVVAIIGNDNDVDLWNPLPAPSFRILPGHQPAEAWSVAFSPDGKSLASVGDDWKLRHWDPYTGDRLELKEDHGSLVASVAWSSDGKFLATGSYDKNAIVYRGQAPYEELHRLPHPFRIRCLAVSPESNLLAVGSRDRKESGIRLWDLQNGQATGTLEGHTNFLMSLAFSPDGRILGSASIDHTVRLWDPTTRKLLRTLPHQEQVFALAFSPDGRTLATGDRTGNVHFWDLGEGRLLASQQHHTSIVRSLAYSPDGRTLASGSQDRTVRLWNPDLYQELLSLPPLTHEVNGVAFSADGAYLAAALHDGNLALWHGPPFRRVGR